MARPRNEQIGDYKIRSCRKLIKITYDDGSISYDSKYGFSNFDDFKESFVSWQCLMMAGTKIASNGRIVKSVDIIDGIDAIRAELSDMV